MSEAKTDKAWLEGYQAALVTAHAIAAEEHERLDKEHGRAVRAWPLWLSSRAYRAFGGCHAAFNIATRIHGAMPKPSPGPTP